MRLPAASLNLLEATPTVATPTPLEDGVNRAEYTRGLMLSWTKLLSVPPVTSISARVKLLEASLRVNWMVSPAPDTVPEPVRATTTVGAVVSVL